MILQKLILPCEFAEKATKLYYRTQSEVNIQDDKILFNQGNEYRFDTLFGSFSIGKWNKYTKIQNLSLCLNLSGDFTVNVYHRFYFEKKQKEEIVYSENVNGDVKIDLPVDVEGIYYFTLTANADDSVFYGGHYADEEEGDYVNVCAVFCTYKREKFITANIEELKNNIINNENSPMYGKLKVLVIDNGHTLPQDDAVTIIPNRNTGGAGGFTRGIIEMLKIREEQNITHVILCDDDIRFESESFVRTYAFLSKLKDEYKDAFIGGSMFRTDKKYIQNERSDKWNYATGKVSPKGFMFDMSKTENLLRNEQPDDANYLSWWYCAIPANIPSKDNLPLPIFIKRDDIEYGLRNGKTFITLNGICVWHEPFETKRPAFLEYYYNRNQCIMESIHKEGFNKKDVKKRMFKEVARDILTFRYNEAEAVITGVKDFLKGTEFIKTTDPTSLNAELMKYNAKSKKIDVPKSYPKDYQGSKKMSKNKKLLALCTLNGWLLPTTKQVNVPAVRPSWKAFFMAKSALNIERGKRGYITKKSYVRAFRCANMYLKTCRDLNKNFEKAKKDFKDNIGSITNLEFWNSYLGLENPLFSETNVKKYKLEIGSNDIIKRKFELFLQRLTKVALKLLCPLIPVKQNKIVFSVTKRKGFSCNPKYVALALKEKFGNKYKMTWVTDFPETCDEVVKNGLKVVKSKTFAHACAQMSAKVVVYNDSVEIYIPKRRRQIYINTWHGGINYKHIGYDYLQDQSKIGLRKFALRNPQPDYYLSGSKFFTENTAQSFRFEESAFMPCGLPRNGLFFNEEKMLEASEKVRKFYGLTDEKVLIYAPTFRNGFIAKTHGLNFALLRETLKEKFGGEWVIFYRGHGFVKGSIAEQEKVYDTTEYHDMQELMATADGMISDYSSAMWDMIFTKKPIFVYADDIRNYEACERSFAYSPEKWPYAIAENNEQLMANIMNYDEKEFYKAVYKHLEEAGSYEKGSASYAVANLIEEYAYGEK